MAVSFEIFAQVIFWGLYSGCIYILLATGLNLIFGVMKIVNFAHGEFLMLGAYITFWTVTVTGIDPYLALIITMLVMAGVGISVERLCFRPILGTGKLNEIFLSLGLIYLFQNTAAFLWTGSYRSIRSPYEQIAIPIGGGVSFPLDYLIIIVVTILLIVIIEFFLRRTETGRAIRATSQNRKAAMLMGINVERMDMISFGIGASIAAAAGTLLVVSGQMFGPYSGSIPAIKAFAIIIIGGLGSLSGAIAGGLLYGLGENIAAVLFGGHWKDAVSFIILIIVLVIRPTGLFGEKGE